MPGSMALMVRFGGQVADQRGSRLPVAVGFIVQALVMVGLWQLPATAPLWQVGILLSAHGIGVGLMLAALHSSAMGDVPDAAIGVAAGVYSMIRFSGMAIGTAIAGVLLERFLSQPMAPINAYQTAFLCYAFVALMGLGVSMALGRPRDRHNG
jgi:MFS family permease